MNLLIVVRTYPHPPRAGDLRLNADLIDALVAEPDTSVTVFCGTGLPETPLSRPGLRWTGSAVPYGSGRRDDLRALLGKKPRAAERALPPKSLESLKRLLDETSFDAVILSESCTAPAAELVRAAGLPVLYVSHNVDIDIRRRIADAVTKPILRRLQQKDAAKYRDMELALLEQADAITAITAEDAARYRALAPDKPVIELSPGYVADPVLPQDHEKTRPLAVIVGSFEWNAKLHNLDDILAAYQAAGGAAAGFDLRIAGRMAPDRLEQYRAGFVDVSFTGEFDSLEEVTADARMALVLEDLGGGFKLKVLDYVFSRLVIVAYPHAMAGSTLAEDGHYVAVSTLPEAMQRIGSMINDTNALDKMSGAALEQARDRFNWPPRARALLQLAAGASTSKVAK
ncbi:glycosyltransferase [Puniceibacterium confluentis]|uniref:glycosyltransferase n=1 Tax=Puniceibacterium confluentis TaxID=1958944 RepID=UPI0011B4FE1D|nr:glycosyltransferase [Puniceibacterium confluentis]